MKGSLTILFLVFFVINLISAADCPYGLVNDSYPGSCGRYVDSDGDGFCDLSEQSLEVQEEIDSGKGAKSNSFIFFVVAGALALVIIGYIFIRKSK